MTPAISTSNAKKIQKEASILVYIKGGLSGAENGHLCMNK